MVVDLVQKRQYSLTSVFWPRLTLGSLLLVCLCFPSRLQSCLSSFYSSLYHSSFYNFSGFETFLTMSSYILIEPLYTYKFGKHPELRVDARGKGVQLRENGKPKVPRMRRPKDRAGEMVVYALPLLAMDFVMIKKFAGVPVADIRATGGYPPIDPSDYESISRSFLLPTLHNFSLSSLLQLRRALPPDPPTARRLVLELIVSFFTYDALFFFIHIAFHRIPALARIHSPHHTHAEIHPQVTNRLSVTERLSLILLANFALNIIGSHVLTRTAFVPIFIYLLIDVHSGIDLPWSYSTIMPFGTGAGTKVHAHHHRTGEGSYAPFFTWWDRGLQWWEQSR